MSERRKKSVYEKGNRRAFDCSRRRSVEHSPTSSVSLCVVRRKTARREAVCVGEMEAKSQNVKMSLSNSVAPTACGYTVRKLLSNTYKSSQKQGREQYCSATHSVTVKGKE